MHFNQSTLLVRLIGKPVVLCQYDAMQKTAEGSYLTKPYPRETPVRGSSIIFALLQLRNGLINLGSLSLRSPRTGLRKTATKSELDVSGAKSPTNMLYSLGYCCAVAG